MSQDNPILNNPYEEPKYHYDTDSSGNLDYAKKCEGRRIFKPEIPAIPTRQKGQKEIFAWNDDVDLGTHLVNLCRTEVSRWRESAYPNTTRITKDLLNYWFNSSERLVTKKLFYAQREAVETAVWLNEVAERSNAGQHILNLLHVGQQSVSENPLDQLNRIAFKMATGSGKTVVMACLICYHYFNRQEYRNDTRFADYFLIVAPGVTIRDRLGVLFVDVKNTNPAEIEDYYRVRGLVPQSLEHRLQNLNARLVITNYHSFEAKTLQGNKRSPFDGKVNLQGEKNDTGNKEDVAQVVKRALGKFKAGSRLLVMNDEAHHCYLPKSKGKTSDNEEADENERAAVWFSGLREIASKFKLQSVYDLSATPYYLQGSGYPAYALFPWIVSEFGLIEAIESGLVKIPFLPEWDNTHQLEMPVLRDLYRKIMDQDPNALPRKGARRQRRDAQEEGDTQIEKRPELPALVKTALDQFYNDYVHYDQGIRKQNEERANLFSPPPVFIVVCNNTAVSKEVYKYIAGYDYESADGTRQVVQGVKELFSNYDHVTGKALRRPPTLLIDSDALENSGQVSDDFKKIFAAEINEFKKDYARTHGQGSLERITDAEILREVVNTVGKQGKLGAHIRCVVSVSMLTEGWDANTVTHIMGLRAFGSQLLCEQVAGRALRRMNYFLQGYDKDGSPTNDKRKIVEEKFPPEYAHIIGVPFKFFKGGKEINPPPLVDYTHVFAMPERQAEFEIEFPNVTGYRMEEAPDELLFDFNGIENYEIRGDLVPYRTMLASAFSPEEVEMQLEGVLQKRDAEIVFRLTRDLIHYHFRDEEENRKFQYFNKLKNIVQYWYENRLVLMNISDPAYKRLVSFDNEKTVADHIARGINPHRNTDEYVRPVFNYYNQFSSTKYVIGNTTKDVYPTERSQVNNVVMDSDWEGIAAKTLEELKVKSYVKNQFLGFTIPYVKEGKDRLYYPDFIAQVVNKEGKLSNVIIEISGMSKDKAEKTWYVEKRWLPAVNAMREKYGYPEWHFIEIANDIRNIRNELVMKFQSLD